jgi:hypothetical protein
MYTINLFISLKHLSVINAHGIGLVEVYLSEIFKIPMIQKLKYSKASRRTFQQL